MERPGALRLVKLLHTAVWTFFVACIAGVLWFGWTGAFERALLCIALVCLEVVVLGLNRWRCPLTPVAARFTDDRRPNFDIYLPAWLARYNKEIFGSLFVAGVLLTIGRRLGWL